MMKKRVLIFIILIILSTIFVACNSSKAVVSISIYSAPDKTTYIIGEELDVAGCKITITYANGSTEVKEVTEAMISGFDTSTIGERTITITYNHLGGVYTTTQSINTVSRKASTLTIVTPPNKTAYADGELINLEGIVVDVLYNNGETATVGSGSLTNTPVQARMGNTAVTVKLNDATATFNISVSPVVVVGLSILQEPTKSTYFAGELFNEEGLKLSVVYNNGDTEQLTEGFTVLYNTLTIETTAVMIRYMQMEIECPITVLPAEAISYEIINYPKTEYDEGDDVFFDGLIVSILFNNNNSIELVYNNQVNWDKVTIITPLSPLTIADNKIVLHFSYGDGAEDCLSIEIPITVS